MESTYNEVTPLTLGRTRAKGRKKGRGNSQKREAEASFIPAPPPESPPQYLAPPGLPDPLTTSDTFVSNMPHPKLQAASPSWSGNNGIHQGAQFIPNDPMLSDLIYRSHTNSERHLPKPTTSGAVLNPQARSTFSSHGLPSHDSTQRNLPQSGNNFLSEALWSTFGTPQTKTGVGLQHSPSTKIINNKKRKTYNNLKHNNQEDNLAFSSPAEDEERIRKRAEKFKTPLKTNGNSNMDDDENFANLNAISTKSHKFDKNKRILGRCQTLEKSYLRLTSEPNPDLVRPLTVLKKTYALLMNKYKKEKASYQYLCDQFKSMRQDLRVQMIENQFTVKVYESHARIALENGDIGEFNQCQSRLIVLFELPNVKASFLEEFTSYRILYYMLTEDNGSMNMLRLKLMTKNQAVFSNHMVRTAFDLAHARLMGDYHNFMKIYASLQTLGKKLVDAFIGKEKVKTLVTICKSYNQIKLDFLINELKFESKDAILAWFQSISLENFIVTKNIGEENEFQYLDTKACRHVVVRQYSDSKKIDIKGQQ